MKKILISILSIICLSVAFISCKNDLNVLAPGKEMVSVYGILDATQPVQNIRINKVYLNDKDALVSAQDANDINYGPGELTVSLQCFYKNNATPQLTTVGNTTKKEIILTETVVTTQGGTFNQTQRLWQTTDRLRRSDASNAYQDIEYKLIIKKTSTGEEMATSQNVLIDSVSSSASNLMPFVYFPTNIASFPNHGQYITFGAGITPTSKYIDYSILSASPKITFKTIKNAKIYDVVMRFHYSDSLSTSTTPVFHYVDFNFNSVTADLAKVPEIKSVDFLANEFYTNLEREINKQTVPNLKNRKALYMEYFVYAGAESLSDFLLVNAPSTTIAQDKPFYTNINGGVGIFSSRSTSSVTKDLISNFVDKIACHPSTFPLLFCDFTTGKPRATSCP